MVSDVMVGLSVVGRRERSLSVTSVMAGAILEYCSSRKPNLGHRRKNHGRDGRYMLLDSGAEVTVRWSLRNATLEHRPK